MKPSGIGGQAVMEGVMMKNKNQYAVAVRKPDQEIVIEVQEFKSIIKNKAVPNIPVLRGVVNFVDSLVLGMKTLTYSASFFEEEEEVDSLKAEKKKAKKAAKEQGMTEEEIKEKKEKQEHFFMGITVCISIIMAVAIFMLLPYYISTILRKQITSHVLLSLFEGIVRLLIFVAYILLISRMKDIQRVFMYHGAEHKCINCIEHGLELTLENVRKSSKEHKRCGTSFLLIVMLFTILFFSFIQVESPMLRVGLRLILIPFIAGIAYEFIRLAGKSENFLVHMLSKPGLWLQNLTTKEPEDEMIQVAMASVEAVFDWENYRKENFGV